MDKLFLYVSHAGVVAEVVRLQGEISRGGGAAAMPLLESSHISNTMRAKPDEVDACVNFGLRLGSAAGLLNSCLTRSVIRCLLLRRSGVDARVAFGLNVGQGALDGHCWVVEGGASPDSDPAGRRYHDIQVFPR